jgi:hypothetical protein
MGRWDNKNTEGRSNGISKKLLIVFIAFMVSMWLLLGIVTTMLGPNIDCDAIEEYMTTDDYYQLPSEERQYVYDALANCRSDDIIVK